MRMSPFGRMRLVVAGIATVGALLLSSVSGSAGDGLPHIVNGKHILWGVGAATNVSPNNLIYHGGLVETTPAVYNVFWGPAWQNGFSFSAGGFTYTNTTVENYLGGFFGNVGGSAFAGIQTQYCQGILPGFSCAGDPSAQFITNPTSQLKGTWVDPSPVPADITTTGLVSNLTTDPLEAEAIKASQHFGYDVNATINIFTEPGHTATLYGTVYCAYHSETSHTTGHGVRYAFVPYVPEQGAGCGQNLVNATNDAFGHGYLDGYSIVAGHEYAEAVTDPGNQSGIQDGWNDATTSENGDKCAWTNLQNITLAGQTYAAQPMWSNEANGGAGGCVFAR